MEGNFPFVGQMKNNQGGGDDPAALSVTAPYPAPRGYALPLSCSLFVPRFRRRNGNGKNPDGQGFQSGDFFAPSAKKYYSSLDSLDSRNGHRAGIAFGRKMCYTLFVSKSKGRKGVSLCIGDYE